ncbi:MAG: dihydroorotate dehydrogenase electron transfer subunit [Prolixibacteraceae bacterium]|nr:dihydroorotate dehydrogenase electron transfer subunit [Prolixibacteraceae bacterium]
MNKTVSDLTIIKNTRLNHDNYLLELQSYIKLEGIIPGQFVNILVSDSQATFLRRPFSIFEVNYHQNSISVLVKVVGPGTEKLSSLKPSDTLNVIFPLGNGFSMPMAKEKILLVGGGVGIAPMMQMAKDSRELGAEVHILLGARTKMDHILIEEFSRFGTVYLTSDDGSVGVKGFVTNHPVLLQNNGFNQIYCCGPEPMMKAVAKKAKELNVRCEVSLENAMACGFGVCLCCVTKTTGGNKCVCTDGPVFNINDLSWPI